MQRHPHHFKIALALAFSAGAWEFIGSSTHTGSWRINWRMGYNCPDGNWSVIVVTNRSLESL